MAGLRIRVIIILSCTAWLSAASSKNLFAQDSVIPERVTFSKAAYELQELLPLLEQAHNLKFYYKPEWIEGLIYLPKDREQSFDQLLINLRSELGINTLVKEPRYIIVLGAPELKEANRKRTVDSKDQSADRITIGDINKFPERSAVLTGVVRDGQRAKALQGVSVSILETKMGSTTDSLGRYRLVLQPGIYTLRFSAVNLQAMEFEISIFNSGDFDVDLYEDVTMLSAVRIQARAETANVQEASMGVTNLDQQELKRIPAFLGEVDVNRVIMSLPGVVSVGEGSPGFNVRGGMVSQNLVLMDDMPIYNPSHLAGFFSAYNPDMVDDITFYRGGIPANFGGRVSSVLDIGLKESNYEKWSGGGGAGLIASRFFVSGPIIKNHTAISAGLRGAYPNYIIRSVPDLELKNSDAYFYDLNFKADHRNEKGQHLSLSAYSSRDNIDFAGNALFNYGNRGISLKALSPVGKFGVLSGSYVMAAYDYTLEGGELDRSYQLKSLLNDNRINASYNYFGFSQHEIEVGVQRVQYKIAPGDYQPLAESTLSNFTLETEHGIETAFYIQDNIDLSNKLKLSAGIRYAVFQRVGPGTQLQYAAGRPTADSNITDTLTYGRRNKLASYGGFEPRLFLTMILDMQSSIKFGYHRNRQFIHLVTNTTAVTPVDLWKLSDNYIRPNIADQFSAGYFRNNRDNSIESSAEGFYKLIRNSVDFKDGANLFLNEQVQEDLLQGTGYAYGAEFLVKKVKGNIKGWAAYTYSRSFLQIDGINSSEKVNNGELYPSNFDRPHDLKLFTDYRMTNRFTMSLNFNYATGRPITLPESFYVISGTTVANYSDRNTYRIPDYHRLDFSATLDGTLKKKKTAAASWTFGIYNLYGRKNPYSVFFKRNERGELESYRLAVIGRPFYSLTYNFTF
jgi:hypothetical protein